MKQNDLKERTNKFALKTINLVQSLPKSCISDVLGRQLLRSGTSVGANYRSACRARPTADFIAKLGIVEEEIDESIYWMELLVQSGLIKHEKLADSLNEAQQLAAITVASIKTAKRNKL
jgi:four helix bundle protein